MGKDNDEQPETALETGGDNGETTEKKKRNRKRKRKRKGVEPQADETKEKGGSGTVEEERMSQVERTIYVAGFPFDATPDEIRGFFQENGCGDIEDLRLPVWQDTGRLRGFGHVVFTSVASKDKAVNEVSGKYLKNRYLNISAAKKPRDPTDHQQSSEPSKTILLQNLSYEANEEDITAVFEKFGEIPSGGVRVVRRSDGDRSSKGFAYVEFVDINSARRAVKERVVIKNRACRMDFDHGRVKGSFRGASGRFWSTEYGNKRSRS